MDERFLKVTAIISEQLDVDIDKITLETSLIDDLEADSLDVVELIMAFEDEFGTKIDEGALENIQTVEDIINAIS
ncbi:acyl carrier protein [Acetobacterium wieringae]|jgi:acyl carrier protein|uniref:Acyl carrier protein n=1 Tax=Acetobacterium wieringae TaxID=52694 RepID=A0A1F2PP32_9FIRM|nr:MULTISPECIES: acyl carrier protein [Acetobacterium]OFV72422.1 acyl carrier protein [Acetobacterium wieringae]OXS25498.1 MAG: acyl carrier protein [Acetobacterium sp. MES1]TYC88396.1 acyl carrier protein [Acetobacterium wieringae]URN82981.1 acyl carrier protein [Acetobacterium wieringae]UYO61358.1 acyl carrier protein [Acetobacterium wieringae]